MMTMQEIIKKVQEQDYQTGMDSNGSEIKYQRFYIYDREYTLVNGNLYEGISVWDGSRHTYSTVPEIKEGRREDRMCINSVINHIALLKAKNVIDENHFEYWLEQDEPTDESLKDFMTDNREL